MEKATYKKQRNLLVDGSGDFVINSGQNQSVINDDDYDKGAFVDDGDNGSIDNTCDKNFLW